MTIKKRKVFSLHFSKHSKLKNYANRKEEQNFVIVYNVSDFKSKNLLSCLVYIKFVQAANLLVIS